MPCCQSPYTLMRVAILARARVGAATASFGGKRLQRVDRQAV